MDDKKVCFVCGEPLIRRYFTMYTPNGEEVKICPKCRKVWEQAQTKKRIAEE